MKRQLIILLYLVLALATGSLGAYLAVSLVVARAPEVEVPSVAGLELAEALDVLSERELDLEVLGFTFSDEIVENRVVRQRPPSGRVVNSGRSVGVVLSRGPERYPAPSLLGKNLEDAGMELREAGLALEVAGRIRGGGAGLVVGQSAEPGHPIPSGRPVKILLSEQNVKELLRMVRVEGLELKEAQDKLGAMGLRVERVEEVDLGPGTKRGVILSQNPLPGFPVERSRGVTLSVSAEPRVTTIVDSKLVVKRMPFGFSSHRVELRIEGGETSLGLRTISDEWIKGGETFRRLVPLRPGERVRVFIDGVESL